MKIDLRIETAENGYILTEKNWKEGDKTFIYEETNQLLKHIGKLIETTE